MPDNILKLRARQQGLTLVELSAVLLVLVGLAGLLVPYAGGEAARSACIASGATLANVRDAIMGSGAGSGYQGDMGDLPHYRDGSGVRHDTLHFLFAPTIAVDEAGTLHTYNANNAAQTAFNPATGRGWRGPYLQGGEADAVTGTGLFAARDAYAARTSIDLQIPAEDADGNGVDDCLDRGYSSRNDCARLVSAGPDGIFQTTPATLNAANRNDDRVLFLRMADSVGNPPCE